MSKNKGGRKKAGWDSRPRFPTKFLPPGFSGCGKDKTYSSVFDDHRRSNPRPEDAGPWYRWARMARLRGIEDSTFEDFERLESAVLEQLERMDARPETTSEVVLSYRKNRQAFIDVRDFRGLVGLFSERPFRNFRGLVRCDFDEARRTYKDLWTPEAVKASAAKAAKLWHGGDLMARLLLSQLTEAVVRSTEALDPDEARRRREAAVSLFHAEIYLMDRRRYKPLPKHEPGERKSDDEIERHRNRVASRARALIDEATRKDSTAETARGRGPATAPPANRARLNGIARGVVEAALDKAQLPAKVKDQFRDEFAADPPLTEADEVDAGKLREAVEARVRAMKAAAQRELRCSERWDWIERCDRSLMLWSDMLTISEQLRELIVNPRLLSARHDDVGEEMLERETWLDLLSKELTALSVKADVLRYEDAVIRCASMTDDGRAGNEATYGTQEFLRDRNAAWKAHARDLRRTKGRLYKAGARPIAREIARTTPWVKPSGERYGFETIRKAIASSL